MSKLNKHYFINFFIFALLVFQVVIYYYNVKPSSQIINNKSMTVENFSSIVLSKSGLTKIGSEKLNKVNENNFYLQGKSYLENEDYKIYGYDITINLNEDISYSKKSVKIINSMGTLNAKGFKNKDAEGKIFFEGDVVFRSHD